MQITIFYPDGSRMENTTEAEALAVGVIKRSSTRLWPRLRASRPAIKSGARSARARAISLRCWGPRLTRLRLACWESPR